MTHFIEVDSDSLEALKNEKRNFFFKKVSNKPINASDKIIFQNEQGSEETERLVLEVHNEGMEGVKKNYLLLVFTTSSNDYE